MKHSPSVLSETEKHGANSVDVNVCIKAIPDGALSNMVKLQLLIQKPKK